MVTIEAGFENEYVPTCAIEVEVYASGLIRTRYQVDGRPDDASEMGIGYRVDDSADRHVFARAGRWSCHPVDHIGRDEGTAPRYPPGRRVYGRQPEWPWASDEIDFHLYGRMDAGAGRGTNDFRGSKHNILYSGAAAPRSEGGRSVAWDGALRACGSVRFRVGWAFITSSTTTGRFRSPAPGTRSGGNDVYRPMPPQDKAKEATANLFVGEPDNIVMEYVEA